MSSVITSWFSLFACIFSMRCSSLLLLPLNSMIISAQRGLAGLRAGVVAMLVARPTPVLCRARELMAAGAWIPVYFGFFCGFIYCECELMRDACPTGAPNWRGARRGLRFLHGNYIWVAALPICLINVHRAPLFSGLFSGVFCRSSVVVRQEWRVARDCGWQWCGGGVNVRHTASGGRAAPRSTPSRAPCVPPACPLRPHRLLLHPLPTPNNFTLTTLYSIIV